MYHRPRLEKSIMDIDAADFAIAAQVLGLGGLNYPGLLGVPRRSPFAAVAEDKYKESCFPLPLYLQDLCLLAVVDDLGSYPEELLASLPQWLRYRLLSSLPAMELSRLEYSPVAKGVDTEAIWKSRSEIPGKDDSLNAHKLSRSSNSDGSSKFKLDICRNRQNISHFYGHSSNTTLTSQDIMLLKGENEQPPGHDYLLEIASDLLCESYGSSIEKSVHQMISIPGKQLLSALMTGSTHQGCHNPYCKKDVWKQQATPLIVRNCDTLPRSYSTYSQEVQLTPRYLMPVCQNADSVTMLSSLVKGCRLHPLSANVHINAISKSLLSSLIAERFALDSGCTLPLKCTPIFEHLLQKVVILSLKCEKYVHIQVMIGMIKAAIANGQDSKLKHLRCIVPNVYMDMVEPLSGLFSLQNFQQLTIDLEEVHPHMLTKLLKAFMTTPCQHKQKLCLKIAQCVQLPKLTTSQLGSINVGSDNIPSCSYKILELSSQSVTNSLNLLLQFSTLRLQDITFDVRSNDNEYLHLCAIHPDLQAIKLTINVHNVTTQIASHVTTMATVQEDIISLFTKPSVDKIVVCGSWGQLTKIKLGLALGLQGRSHLQLPPLKELSLELESAHSYKVRDFQSLCDAMFSLPQLENLELVLGKGFVDMIKQKRFEEVLYESWCLKGSNVKLKSVCLQVRETKLQLLPLIAQTLSFSFKPRFESLMQSFSYSSYDAFDFPYGDDYDYPHSVYYDSDDYDDYDGYMYDYY